MGDVAMDSPELKRVRARDVVPYHWAVWCTVGDGKPFGNTVEHVSWSEDGEHLWFLLGTHNTYKAKPDEEVELVPCDVSWMSAASIEDVRRRHADTIAKGPPPLVACAACRGTGKVAHKGNPFA